MAYAANRQVTLWDTTAQVRSPVATVNFGDRLQILDRFGDEVEVRTAAGRVHPPVRLAAIVPALPILMAARVRRRTRRHFLNRHPHPVSRHHHPAKKALRQRSKARDRSSTLSGRQSRLRPQSSRFARFV